eukprot:13981377-Ditylum_brightwellii.AAC.1
MDRNKTVSRCLSTPTCLAQVGHEDSGDAERARNSTLDNQGATTSLSNISGRAWIRGVISSRSQYAADQQMSCSTIGW